MKRKLVTAGIARGTGAVSLLIVYYVVAQRLPDGDAGEVFLALTVSAITTPLLLQGRNSLLVRELPKLSSAATQIRFIHQTISRFLALNLPATLVAAAVTLVLWRDLAHLTLVITLVTIQPLVWMIGHALQGLKRVNTAVVAMNILMPAFLVASIELSAVVRPSLVDRSGVLFALLPASAVASALTGVALLANASRSISSDATVTDEEAPQVLTASADLRLFWAVHVMVGLNNWSPQLVYWLFSTDENFAYFSTAQRVANVVAFVIIVANFAVAPYVAEMVGAGDIAGLQRMYSNVTRLTTAIATPIAVGLFVAAPTVMTLFGDGFSAGASLLRVFCVVQLVNVATGVTNTVLNMSGKTALLLKAMVAALALGSAALIPLVFLFGDLGFALATATVLISQNLLAARYVNRSFAIHPMRVFLPTRRA